MPVQAHWEEEPIQRNNTIEYAPIIIGLLALILGALVYLTDRSPGSVYFINDEMVRLSMYTGGHRFFGRLGNHLPSFIHVFSFSLLTIGTMGFMKKQHANAFYACLFWFAVNTLFELGQAFPVQASALCPNWFSVFPYLENTGSFFRNGTFDPWDIVSFSAGAFAAWAVFRSLKKRDMGYELSYEKSH